MQELEEEAKQYELRIFGSITPNETWKEKAQYIDISNGAFLVGYRRPRANSYTWHIWLAGVLPDMRESRGRWLPLLHRFIAHRPPGINVISICSCDYFTRMIAMLTKPGNGWIERETTGAIRAPDGIKYKKRYFEMEM